MTDIPLQDLLKVAEEAADAAAQILREGYERLHASGTESIGVRQKGSGGMDPVTAVDVAAQERIIAVIQKHFPSHRFLAEEEGADALGDPASPYMWIIDPLDGTLNFVHGKKQFGTIVTVMKDDQFLAGCMVLPLLGHRFTAAKGQGAFADGQPMKLRNTANLQDAILCSNITRRANRDSEGVLQVRIPPCASVHNYGCAAWEIGEVLLGHNDGMFARGLKIWDVAAGFLMLEEAGGKYRYERIEAGNPRGGLICAATTTPIFEEVCSFAFAQKLA